MAFKQGVAAPDDGSHKPSKVTTSGATTLRPVSKMRRNSKDGQVTTAHPEDSQGWFRNEDVHHVKS